MSRRRIVIALEPKAQTHPKIDCWCGRENGIVPSDLSKGETVSGGLSRFAIPMRCQQICWLFAKH